MRTRTYGLLAGLLGGLSAVLIGGGIMTPAPEVPTAFAQETPATNTATTTTTTTTTPVTNTATVTTTTTTTATATQATATATTATATATTATATATTATATATTPAATATPTRTNTPVPPTATSVPPTQGPPTQPATAPINLTLSGANEVPPVSSPGTGKFLATTTNTSLSYTLTASGTTSGITMAHIHQGAPGTNGPIVADLIVPNPSGVGSINQSGIITEASLKGPLAGADFATFLTALRAGQLYVNVHTTTNPGGEVRAQFPTPPGPPATGTTQATTTTGSDAIFYAAAALAGAGALAFGAGAFARRKR